MYHLTRSSLVIAGIFNIAVGLGFGVGVPTNVGTTLICLAILMEKSEGA